MSRIGKRPVAIPEKVKVQLIGNQMSAEGPKGKGNLTIGKNINVRIEGNQVIVERPDESAEARAMHGLTRTIVNNLITGVSAGFSKILDINGVGFRAEVKGQELHLTLGFSHPVVFPLPQGVSASVEKQTRLTITGSDKQVIGETASKIRSLRLPEPYKGKGIKYAEETIRRKQGKTGAA
ncbi:50S ribosomal protein L6 [Vulgatibacter incomptus]|uniref:Large ribosomal subunit protein uL6 n=1 Tax=Vulgatibacter incomptus TaxID=1391653 RepID=A0A0K1PEM4_9BACT|nr:50S ribosomal protein L6 [Vulgatibacter incomptus]AKU91574.1 LSU ribosomal protein L6p (L9e) [Vulgatibacter incomptus]